MGTQGAGVAEADNLAVKLQVSKHGHVSLRSAPCSVKCPRQCPRQDSNLRARLRRPLLHVSLSWVNALWGSRAGASPGQECC